MKPYKILSLFALAAAALIVAACQSDDFEGLADGRCPIAFDAQLGWEKDQTRASIQTAANLNKFKVTCVKKNASKGDSYYFKNLVVSKSGSTWTNATDYYWLATGKETYDFYAYAPSTYPSVTNPSTPGAPTFTYDASTTNCDLTAAVVTGKSDRPTTLADAKVNLALDHLLTGIRFKVADGCAAISIKKIKITGIYFSGKCTYSSGQWQWSNLATSTAKSIVRNLSFDTSGSDKNIDNPTTEASFFVIPQTIPSGAKFELTYNDGTTDQTLTADLSGTWTQGQIVTYAIGVQASEPTVSFTFTLQDGDVVSWDGATSSATQKTAWAAGDIIYVGFKNQKTGLLKFTYNGTSWGDPVTIGTLDLKAVAEGSSEATNRTCMAFWVEGNPGEEGLGYLWNTGYIIATNKGRCYLRNTNVGFKYNAKTISADFTLSRESGSVKIAVTGLGIDNDSWQVCAKELKYITQVYINNGYSLTSDYSSKRGIDKAFSGDGYKIGNETCFYVELYTATNAYSSDAGSVIYLKNTTTGKIYRKQFAGKYLRSKTYGTMGGKTINITFDNTWSEISAEDFAALEDIGVIPTTLNGHEYVDLGLPSGTKWATCNIGATSPTAYGDYFAWGETETRSSYTHGNDCSTYNKTIDQLRTAGYIDDNNNLIAAYDAATAKWGTGWRMPTSAEIQELLDNCTWTKKTSSNTDYNGVAGYVVKSKTNSNSIFLPFAGRMTSAGLGLDGTNGYYRSSTAYEDMGNAYNLNIGSWDKKLDKYFRDDGQTIRPVTK